MTVDPQPRYVTLHQMAGATADNHGGYPVAYVLDACYREVYRVIGQANKPERAVGRCGGAQGRS